MKEEIKKLLEKHKDFVKQIKNELIKDNDDFGNARRLEDYIKELKEKTVADKEEKEMILKEMKYDYDASDSYQRFLDEFDEPRWYLEKTYPIFYKFFKNKFNKFWEYWTSKINTEFREDYKEALFVEYCKRINYEIENSTSYKETVIEVEKIGGPDKMEGKINFSRDLFFQLLDELFDIPELIIATLTAEKQKVEKKLENWENKYSKYPVSLYKKAYWLQNVAKKNQLKLTDENAIIKANRELKLINEKDLVGEDGKPTIITYRIAKTYANYWKPKLKMREK